MKWERKIMCYAGALISGRYKIVRYRFYPDGTPAPRGSHEGKYPKWSLWLYYAYYKPIGWDNWGNNIAYRNDAFMSIEDAKKACKVHKDNTGKTDRCHDEIINSGIKIITTR
jgi:hypothetical protein